MGQRHQCDGNSNGGGGDGGIIDGRFSFTENPQHLSIDRFIDTKKYCTPFIYLLRDCVTNGKCTEFSVQFLCWCIVCMHVVLVIELVIVIGCTNFESLSKTHSTSLQNNFTDTKLALT